MLLLLVLSSVTVITLDYRDSDQGALAGVRRAAQDAFAPVQSGADRVFAPVGDFFSGIFDYGDLKAENDRLRRELDQTRGDQLLVEGAERERRAMAELLRLDWAGATPSVAARVVSVAPTNFVQTVVIDRGSTDGLGVGMPVVTGAGLAGKLIEVSRERSTVLLLTDRSFSVGVRFAGSGAVGVAEGHGRGRPLAVDFVDTATPVRPDEAVVTAGFGNSAFPPEVPVGRVRDAANPPAALQQVVTIDPVVDFDRLEFVKVLLWKGAG